ncbi:MAG TPA: hypothetical protein VEX36_01675 [Thermoleophilaceae bacterium]|nr:hypothetical protein [Thermoleophilaceae bacterium]
MILAFAGRRPGTESFPDAMVDAVGEEVARLVARLAPRRVVGSAAAGGDLLVAEAALAAGARVELLLAGDRARFRATSVADKGDVWAERFDSLLERDGVAVTEIASLGDGEEAYRGVTRAIAERARRLGEGGEPIGLLAVAGRRAGPPGHTEELVAAAEASGWRVWTIDPAEPGAARW